MGTATTYIIKDSYVNISYSFRNTLPREDKFVDQ